MIWKPQSCEKSTLTVVATHAGAPIPTSVSVKYLAKDSQSRLQSSSCICLSDKINAV